MDLALVLAALALAVLAALGVQAWWSARRSAPRQPQVDAGEVSIASHADPISGAIPPLGLPSVSASPPFDGMSRSEMAAVRGGGGLFDATSASEPILTDPPRRATADVDPPPLRQRGRLDALIDALVTVTVEAPVAGELALAHMPGSRRAGSKPMAIEGLNVMDGQWEIPVHGQSYSEFQAGVQLANRAGALNEIEYSEFVQKVEAFALGVGAMADLPDMLEVVARARELDAFAQPRDAQLVVVLRASTVAWSIGYVHQCAARHGFVPGALPGRLVVPGAAAGDPPVLVLSYDGQAVMSDDPEASALLEIRLSLDVAQTPESAEPFPAWHRAATALAAEMEARVVDAEGHPVTLQLFDGIARDLQGLYRELEARDLAAGSPAARRLFS